jgi:hypothetical protein
VQRLSEQTTKEERVIALVKSGISLSFIFFVAGPKCLSKDEIFKAIQYKKMLEAWEKSTKERKKLVDEWVLHEKARVAESKVTKTKPDYEKLLRWKMGADKLKKEWKGKKLDALKILWNKYKDHAVILIFVPEKQPSPPPVPAISKKALGQASTRFVMQAILSNIKNMDRNDILELRKELDNALEQNLK